MQKMGVFCKIQDICYKMGTEIFKIEEEMTEKMKLQVANPPLNFHIELKEKAPPNYSRAFS